MSDMKPQFIYDPETKCIVQIDQPTLRDQFAMAALTSMLDKVQSIQEETFALAASYAYKFADSMLEARK